MIRLRLNLNSVLAAAGALLLLIAAAPDAAAQLPGREVTVTTVAGAFAGYVDGDNTVSQFDTPSSMSIGPDGRVYVADRGNNRIRSLSVGDNIVETYLGEGGRAARLQDPIDLAFDLEGNLFVVNFGSGTVERFNRFGNADAAPYVSGLFQPMSISVSPTGSLWVGEANGRVSEWSTNRTLLRSFTIPGGEATGLAFSTVRHLAISDSRQHVIWQFNTVTGEGPTILAGARNQAGYQEGLGGLARFNNPQNIATAINGNLVVADSNNHRVRVITCDGNTFTLYGVDPINWVGGGIPPEDYLGWRDGDALTAESRSPVGVVSALDGTVLVSETYFHIIREVTGFVPPISDCPGLPPAPGPGTNGLANPTLSISSGYFPGGVTVELGNPSDFPDGTRFYYTLNGTDPTTNSPSVRVVDGQAQIRITNPTIDLSSLRLLAVSGTNQSVVVSGTRKTFDDEIAGEVGVPLTLSGEIVGGPGATVIIPVVANVRPGVTLRSLGFIAEVAPEFGSTPTPLGVQALPMGGAQRIPIIAASTNAPSAQNLSFANRAARLTVSYSATDVSFRVNNYAVVAMLAVQIPGNAEDGATYRVRFGGISGATLDSPVALQPMGDQRIRVRTIPYLVGDPSPSYWYNAGDFGDGTIDNNDVDAILFAVLRLRVPYAASDLYDTMDTFFPDTPPTAGGNRQLLFSDWETALQRYSEADQSDYLRFWVDGVRRSEGTNVSTFPLASFSALSAPDPEVVWQRDATLSFGAAHNAIGGMIAQIPVYLNAAHPNGISGLLVSATVTGQPGAPGISQNISFTPAAGIASPTQSGNGAPATPRPNYIFLAWTTGSLNPALHGKVLLGHLNVPLPRNSTGASYAVAFEYGGGATARQGITPLSDLSFQTASATLEVGAQIQPAPETIAGEWKTRFFGANSAGADAAADPDKDGFTNAEEFIAGLHPLQRNARAQVRNGVFVLRWGGEWEREYEVQRSNDLNKWTPVLPRLEGRNSLLEFNEAASSGERGQFYRVVRIPSAQ